MWAERVESRSHARTVGELLDCYALGMLPMEDGTANAFDSLWQRFMARVLAKTTVEERFTEHDLRAKSASDAETPDRAQELLAHADSATTRRITGDARSACDP
jgi:integrase